MTTTDTDTIEGLITTARQFLAVPDATLPDAAWMDLDDAHQPGSAWRVLRALAVGDEYHVAGACGCTLRLHADAEGWREGVIIAIPAASPTFRRVLSFARTGIRSYNRIDGTYVTDDPKSGPHARQSRDTEAR